MEDLYANSYSQDIPNRRAIKVYQKTASTIRKLCKETIARRGVESHERPRLLDIGCNLGFFLHEAAHSGFVTTGIDISQAAIDFVNERSIASARRATIEEYAALSDVRFEAVTSFDVIEHVANPRSFLDGACGLVRTGGVLAIRTPNVDSAFARLNFETWYYTDPPFHINYFGRNLIDYVEMRGFKLVRSRYAFAPSMITHYLGIRWKILEKQKAGCVGESHNYEGEKVSAARKIIESSFDALNAAASWLRIGDSMLLFFRKTS